MNQDCKNTETQNATWKSCEFVIRCSTQVKNQAEIAGVGAGWWGRVVVITANENKKLLEYHHQQQQQQRM